MGPDLRKCTQAAKLRRAGVIPFGGAQEGLRRAYRAVMAFMEDLGERRGHEEPLQGHGSAGSPRAPSGILTRCVRPTGTRPRHVDVKPPTLMATACVSPWPCTRTGKGNPLSMCATAACDASVPRCHEVSRNRSVCPRSHPGRSNALKVAYGRPPRPVRGSPGGRRSASAGPGKRDATPRLDLPLFASNALGRVVAAPLPTTQAPQVRSFDTPPASKAWASAQTQNFPSPSHSQPPPAASQGQQKTVRGRRRPLPRRSCMQSRGGGVASSTQPPRPVRPGVRPTVSALTFHAL